MKHDGTMNKYEYVNNVIAYSINFVGYIQRIKVHCISYRGKESVKRNLGPFASQWENLQSNDVTLRCVQQNSKKIQSRLFTLNTSVKFKL